MNELFLKDQCSMAQTNTNSLHKKCPSFISQLKLPDSFSSAAASKSLTFSIHPLSHFPCCC